MFAQMKEVQIPKAQVICDKHTHSLVIFPLFFSLPYSPCPTPHLPSPPGPLSASSPSSLNPLPLSHTQRDLATALADIKRDAVAQLSLLHTNYPSQTQNVCKNMSSHIHVYMYTQFHISHFVLICAWLCYAPLTHVYVHPQEVTLLESKADNAIHARASENRQVIQAILTTAQHASLKDYKEVTCDTCYIHETQSNRGGNEEIVPLVY
jgi:hypothetical protein